METVFTEASEFEAALAARIAPHAPPELAAAVASGIVAGEQAWRASPPARGGTALNLRVGAYFIRDEDLPFIDTLAAAATAVASAAASGGITLLIAIPAVSSLVTLAWDLWRRGGRLTPDQLRVYGVLREHGPCSAAELAPFAAAAGVPAEADQVERILSALSELETRNGAVVPLASKSDGLWRTLNI